MNIETFISFNLKRIKKINNKNHKNELRKLVPTIG